MASAWEPHLFSRDSGSSDGKLSTGAIAGIAGGAGALFLGAAGLFILYWRRQRQWDREEDYSRDSFDEMRPSGAMVPALTYTMDYKMSHQHHEGDQGSSYTYSPEKAAYSFSPPGAIESGSAMPTHPAYIPRALVRGSSTAPSYLSTSTMTNSNTPRRLPSPPPPASTRNQLDDAVIQAYLEAAQTKASSTPNYPLSPDDYPRDSDSSLPSGLPIQTHHHHHHHHQAPTQIPAAIMVPVPAFPSPSSGTVSSSSTSGGPVLQPLKKPRACPPPRLNLSGDGGHTSSTTTTTTTTTTGTATGYQTTAQQPPAMTMYTKSNIPLAGREGTTISGPLAFPQYAQHSPPLNHPSSSGKTNKGKSKSKWKRLSFHGGSGQTDDDGAYGDGEEAAAGQSQSERRGGQGSSSGDGKGKDKDKKKHGRKRSDRNSGNRYYAEIEVGRGSDIW